MIEPHKEGIKLEGNGKGEFFYQELGGGTKKGICPKSVNPSILKAHIS